jgi:DNA/RNA-binding domain of Phe-tRNA-synthetase-like protein
MKLTLAENLTGIVRLGVLRLVGSQIPEDRAPIDREMDALCESIASEHEGQSSGQVPGVAEARRLYKAVGLDPTKTRPSSEALLRRVLKGQSLYRIHPLVDLFNLASLTSLLPVGLYDESKIVGDEVKVEIGREGWGFDGIRKSRVNVSGRLCVTDQDGPFGSPTSDSLRTSIEGEVERVVAVFFQPADGEIERLKSAFHAGADLTVRHLGAQVRERFVLPYRTH